MSGSACGSMGEIGGKHGWGSVCIGFKLVGVCLVGVWRVCCGSMSLNSMVEGVGVGGCAGAAQSSDVFVGEKDGADGDRVHVERESMSMVDGVGVGGCAGSAHSSAVFMGGIVVCAGGVVGLLVAGVCVEVVGEDR